MADFRNQTVVVTGGASGIGLACCHRFARAGARLAVLDFDQAALEAACRELRATGAEVLGVPCDVTAPGDCARAARAVGERFGGVDVLINNAGITQRDSFLRTELAVFKKVMEVNFFGSLNCTKAMIDSLIARRGLIIVIESVAGIAPLLGRSGYCASKHALHGLFTTLRTEIRHTGTHVMIVCPGFVETNLQRRALGGDGQVTRHPQSTVGKTETPASVAEAIFEGAQARKHLLVLTPAGKLGYWVSRLAPVLYERIIERKFAAELER